MDELKLQYELKPMDLFWFRWCAGFSSRLFWAVYVFEAWIAYLKVPKISPASTFFVLFMFYFIWEMLIFLVIWTIVCVLNNLVLHRNAAKSMGLISFVLSSGKILVDGRKGKSEYNLAEVDRIKKYLRVIAIYTTGESAEIVPKTAFSTDAAWQTFHKDLLSQWQSFRRGV